MAQHHTRVLVARIFHESHSFNPRATRSESFIVRRGEAMLADIDSSASILAGLVTRLTETDYCCVPTFSAVAPPGGLVDHQFYLTLKADLIARARKGDFDAVALELHGAMATDQIADVEGDLLSDIRACVGEEIPIVAGFDLHGHVTPAMLAAADVCIACKENPHSDLFECGEKVGACLHAILEGRLRPVTSLVKVPMILTGGAETGYGPLAELHRRARRAVGANKALWDVSLFNVFPFADDVEMGQAVVCLSDGETEAGAEVARSLADLFWAWRERFVDDFPSIEMALDQVEREEALRPFALADMGDRVLAGAPGDSTAILEAALARAGRLKGAIPITDPESVQRAIAAGLGKKVTLKLGGGITPGFGPFEISGEVVSLSKGRFIIKGPYHAGEDSSLGPTAVIKVGALLLMVTTLPGFTQDPSAFESQGIDLATLDFLVVKSGYHFKISFEGIATPLLVETPGIARYRPGFFEWTKGRIYPVHAIDHWSPAADVFMRREIWPKPLKEPVKKHSGA